MWLTFDLYSILLDDERNFVLKNKVAFLLIDTKTKENEIFKANKEAEVEWGFLWR